MRPALRDLAIVLGVSWIARAAFAIAIGDAHSLDVEYWEGALAAQDEGTNPYETGVLNWPPLWLMVIVSVDYLANLANVEFWTALRVYLVLVESLVIVVLYATLLASGAGRDGVRRVLLIGIALNPVAIILICQQGNSDVQVGLFVTLAIAALAAHARSRDVVMWLAGSLFLGLGVLAKTTPLVLAPLLAPGARIVTWAGRGLGAALFLGPAALGVGVILVLAPTAVWDHVIGYRSTRGFFGLSGLVTELDGFELRFALISVAALAASAAIVFAWRRSVPVSPGKAFLLASAGLVVGVVWLVEALDRFTGVDGKERYPRAFTVAVAILLVWLWRRLWRETPADAPRLFLLVTVIFMIVVAFGPGYGAHYAYWFLPALIGTYVLLDDAWRRILQVAWLVAALTYGIEYAVVDFIGAWAIAMLGESEWLTDAGEFLSTPHHWVLFRLPLFVTYLVVIAAGIERLRRGELAARYDATP